MLLILNRKEHWMENTGSKKFVVSVGPWLMGHEIQSMHDHKVGMVRRKYLE